MDASTVFIIMRKELREARRHRWFALFTALFTVLSLGLSGLGLSGLGGLGIAGFGRTAASLVNLIVLIVPLMGLLIGAVSVAGERERGTLLTLLAQPVTIGEVLLGKFFGAAAALGAVVLLGCSVSGVLIARAAGLSEMGAYLAVISLTLLLGCVHLGLGLLISVLTGRTNTAMSLAIVVWLGVVLLSDLGMMGTAIVLRLSAGQLLWLSLGNPAQVFKLAATQALQGHLEGLGSSGLYAASVLGGWLLPLLISLLCGWMALTVGLAWAGFQRRGAL
ncbi:MAG: ABC transporter permease [Candidatus Omnitrophica bacterium]|nr:ABC transporter permease [Candidatus Omnitrophota bacterium]